jgi:hypothetical protein
MNLTMLMIPIKRTLGLRNIYKNVPFSLNLKRRRLKPHPFPVYPGAHTQISIPAASKADLKAKAREAASGFVQYRVFVLDANEEEMREKMPHLMMKMYGEGEGSLG